MREELRVVIDVDCVHEGQRVETPLELWIPVFFERVLVVVDVCADSVPADALNVLDFVGVAEDFHAIVVEGVILGQIDYVEAYFLSFGCVANSEKKPLRVTIGIDVILQNEVVLVVRLLDDSQQVA